MPEKYTLRTLKPFITAAALALALTCSGHAQVCRSQCEPSSAVYQSPFFGYYRTCWRPWPGGQPLCPRYLVPQAGEPAAKARTSERAIEQLPLPQLEEPEIK